MTDATTLYGIPSDTVKKARAWLADHQQPTTFHDFKKQGVPEECLNRWLTAVGWEALLNRKGSTWRTLDVATQAGVTDAASARALMLQHASVIKRPVVEWADGQVTVGFAPPDWEKRVG
jgi:Spx/MgsR family transcriptional regulator